MHVTNFVCFVFPGESPGCRLFGTVSMSEWLITPPPPPLTGEQYGKMEPKYPEGGVFYKTTLVAYKIHLGCMWE